MEDVTFLLGVSLRSTYARPIYILIARFGQCARDPAIIALQQELCDTLDVLLRYSPKLHLAEGDALELYARYMFIKAKKGTLVARLVRERCEREVRAWINATGTAAPTSNNAEPFEHPSRPSHPSYPSILQMLHLLHIPQHKIRRVCSK